MRVRAREGFYAIHTKPQSSVSLMPRAASVHAGAACQFDVGGGRNPPGDQIRSSSVQPCDNEARAFETFLKKRHHYLKDDQCASHLPGSRWHQTGRSARRRGQGLPSEAILVSSTSLTALNQSRPSCQLGSPRMPAGFRRGYSSRTGRVRRPVRQ